MEEMLTKKQRRALRKEQESRRRMTMQRQQRLKKFFVAAILIILFAGGGWALSRYSNFDTASPGRTVTTLGNQHISNNSSEHIPYNTKPPTSGPHISSVAPWGISYEPIPDELQVHNLEDGGVGVQYHCPEGCDELISELETIVSDYKSEVFMAPYPDMESRIALTAWGRIDSFDEFDEERIRSFIDAYRGIDHHIQSGSLRF